MKKDPNLPKKNIRIINHSNNNSRKSLPDSYNNYRQQSPYQINFRGRSSNSRIVIADRIIKRINIAINIQDRIQTEAITQTMTEIVPIQTLEIDTIQMIVQVIHHVIEIKIIQTIEIDMIQIKNHATAPRIDQITQKKMDSVKTPEIDATITQGDSKTTLSHHIDLTLNIQNHNKTTEVVHQYTTHQINLSNKYSMSQI